MRSGILDEETREASTQQWRLHLQLGPAAEVPKCCLTQPHLYSPHSIGASDYGPRHQNLDRRKLRNPLKL
jgi:hypothetical protein